MCRHAASAVHQDDVRPITPRELDGLLAVGRARKYLEILVLLGEQRRDPFSDQRLISAISTRTFQPAHGLPSSFEALPNSSMRSNHINRPARRLKPPAAPPRGARSDQRSRPGALHRAASADEFSKFGHSDQSEMSWCRDRETGRDRRRGSRRPAFGRSQPAHRGGRRRDAPAHALNIAERLAEDALNRQAAIAQSGTRLLVDLIETLTPLRAAKSLSSPDIRIELQVVGRAQALDGFAGARKLFAAVSSAVARLPATRADQPTDSA